MSSTARGGSSASAQAAFRRSGLRQLGAAALVTIAGLAFACSGRETGDIAARATTMVLADGWRIRSSAELPGIGAKGATGAEISRPGFDLSGWTPTSAPSTVLAALVRAGEYTDIYLGDNLARIPEERFTVPWWYRVELTAPDPLPANARLVFEGINYSAEVWLNGRLLAPRSDMSGAFRVFELDVTRDLAAGTNVLAVAVHPPEAGDPTIGFVDWNPKPPDRNLGIWREVKLRTTGPVTLDEPYVRTDVDLPSGAAAHLTIGVRASNRGASAIEARLRGTIGEIAFEQVVALAPGEARDLVLSEKEIPQLRISSPRLWWPNGLGEPELYRLELVAEVGGVLSDRQAIDFGIRRIDDYLSAEGHRGYRINGKDLLIRGGGWVDDLLLADDRRRLEDQIRYVKQMNLNTIRLEGFWGSTHDLFDLADRYGILVWVGWSCQWEWENYLGQPVDPDYGGIDTPAEIELVTRSFRDQVVRLRNHPSVMVWNLGSDMLPRPELERRYRELLATIDPTRPSLAACSTRTSSISGPTGVKMNGPYEWVPPEYWFTDRERGGAFGFNTETGPGAQPSPAGSLRRMMGREHEWPIDDIWTYHCGRNEFANLNRYLQALDARYGPSTGLEEFALKAQAANYEAMRAMFEAFSLGRPRTTGVVQWMLNSAWPDLFWQLYDWYLVPNGAYFAARNANRPLNLAFDYGRRQVVAVNDRATTLAGASARIRIFDLGSKVLFDETRPVTLEPESRADLLAVPQPATGSTPYFLDLRLADRDGHELAASFYWLAARPDVLDWEKSEWFVTPVSRFADLRPLSKLPAAELEVTHRFSSDPRGTAIEVELHNPGPGIAFFVELAVVGSASGRLAAPILWDDNYLSLLPGERRTAHGSFPAHALDAGGDGPPLFRYHGFNVQGETAR